MYGDTMLNWSKLLNIKVNKEVYLKEYINIGYKYIYLYKINDYHFDMNICKEIQIEKNIDLLYVFNKKFEVYYYYEELEILLELTEKSLIILY